MTFEKMIKDADFIVAWSNWFEDKQLGRFASYADFRNSFPGAEITDVQELEPNVFYVYC